jgi:hypothetical protein
MRVAMMVAALVGAVMFSGPAAAFDEPKPLVQAIYDSYRAGEAVPDLTPFYSERLKAIFATYYEEQRAEATPEADTPFDPFVGGDNPLLFDLRIGEPMVLGERAVVDVSFNNFDHPSLLSLALTKEEDGWKVDDVTSHGGEEPWLLSWLLQYDPLSY